MSNDTPFNPSAINPPTRICSVCRQKLPATREFFNKKRNGLNSQCRLCRAARRRELRVQRGQKVGRRLGPQPYDIIDDTVHLHIGLDITVWLDPSDLASVITSRWMVGSHGYAQCQRKIDGKYRSVLMHRLIMDAPRGSEIDHINGNKLDNRRANLRFVTRSQNRQNLYKARTDNVSGVRGVHYDAKRNRYRAVVYLNGRWVYARWFATLEEAKAAVKEARSRFMTHAPENGDDA